MWLDMHRLNMVGAGCEVGSDRFEGSRLVLIATGSCFLTGACAADRVF